jgi:hypothetical protein
VLYHKKPFQPSLIFEGKKALTVGRVTRLLGEKNCQIFQRIAEKAAKSKKSQNICNKAQNIYTKPLLKP